MKGWCKIYKFPKYDVLVERLVNKSDGEHVSVKVRFEEGQYVLLARCGEGEVGERLSVELYEKYNKEDALKFLEQFSELYNEKGSKEAKVRS